MRFSGVARLTGALLAAVVAVCLAIPVLAPAAVKRAPDRPRVTTSGTRKLAGSSAELEGVVQPNGIAASYYFQWGPTLAYGRQTPTISAGNGTGKVKVGQTINGLAQGVTYHYRIVGIYSIGGVPQPPLLGRDRSFAIEGQLKFEVPKIAPIPVGSPFVVSGLLRGIGNARQPIQLQASPYPYTSTYTTIGASTLTDSLGRFAFRITGFKTSTAFRLVALEPRPLYSPVVRVSAAARVALHVRTSARARGIVRLYGTVWPALAGAHLTIQLRKPIKSNRPSKSEATTRFANVFSTVVKKAGTTSSRFSIIIRVPETGRYRAYVKLPKGGPIVSGSSATVVLHAAPNSGRRKHKP